MIVILASMALRLPSPLPEGEWFRVPVLGQVLRHILGRHLPEHMLVHMPEYVLKQVPKHMLRHMLDKHVPNRMAHAVLMT